MPISAAKTIEIWIFGSELLGDILVMMVAINKPNQLTLWQTNIAIENGHL
jgi:hypothetical protein